jgi:ribosomal protein S18 acetylase RimI-like enzyme
MEHLIRKIEATDRERLLEVVQATKNFSQEELAIAEELVEIVLTQPDQTDYYGFVCEAASNGVVAGFLLIGPTPATAGTYDMYWIVVDPAYQGQAVAQALDAQAVKFVKERNGYWLIAETSSQPSYERSRAFYVKQGYSVLARIPDYYKLDDDLIVFGKRVGEFGNEKRVGHHAVVGAAL